MGFLGHGYNVIFKKNNYFRIMYISYLVFPNWLISSNSTVCLMELKNKYWYCEYFGMQIHHKTTYFYLFLSLFCHSSDKEQLIYILINITMRLLRKQFYMLSWNSRKRFKESLMYFSRAMWIFWKRNTTEPWQQCNGINLSNKFLIVHVVRNSTKFFYLCENIIKYTKNNKFTSFILFS